MTGEMPVTLETIFENIYLEVVAPRHLPQTPRTNRGRSCVLDVRNRLLLVMIRLPDVLAHIFCLYKSTVAERIYHVMPILFVNYQNYNLGFHQSAIKSKNRNSDIRSLFLPFAVCTCGFLSNRRILITRGFQN